ncbi:hypothetical protein HALA3H3_450007 [Halomonas sp. A3H3]|nr:hypothetical protein HALA3H3_450007 [Halomonas sp. A3H3]
MRYCNQLGLQYLSGSISDVRVEAASSLGAIIIDGEGDKNGERSFTTR